MSSDVRNPQEVLDDRAAGVRDEIERVLTDLGSEPSVAAVRATYASLAQRHGISPGTVANLDAREVPGRESAVPVQVYRPEGAGLFPIIVYLHGGGGVAGSAAEAVGACSTLARVCNAVVVAPDYRLAPEWPFPAGADDAESVVRWCMSQASVIEGDAERVALVGEGWGANLAFGLSARLAHEEALQPAMQLLVDPVLAPLDQTPSAAKYGRGFGVGPALVAQCRDWYFGGRAATDDGSAWPAGVSRLAVVPPTLVVTCECDPFRDQSEEYVKHVAAGGSMAALKRCQGLIHGSVVTYGGTIFRGRMALEQMARALRLGLRTGWEPLLALEG
jgi:acetyl esterase